MKPSDIPIEQLVPHGGNMVLVDRLLEADKDSATALVKVRNGGIFCGNQATVPAWAGIEYMAQTIAAWAGYQAVSRNEPVKIGFLVGTRRYTSNVSHFNCDDPLTVQIKRNFGEDSGMGSFDCTISGTTVSGGQVEIVSTLNVFQPNEQQIKEMMEATP